MSISDLLLSGWRMRAEACGTCSVPLMTNPHTLHSTCVQCKAEFDEQLRPLQLNQESAAPQDGSTHKAAEPASAAQANVTGGPLHTEAPSWRAVADISDLPASKAFGPASEPGGVRVPQLYRSLQSSPEPDVADKLAEKMLQGWAMTAMHCPRCKNIAVRSKQQELWCVECSAYLRSDKVAGQQQQQQEQQQQQQQRQ